MVTADDAPDPATAAIDRLTEAIEASTSVTGNLAGAVEESEHRRRRNARIGAVILVAVWQLAGKQAAIRDTQAAIADCTDLERRSAECARRAQANTAKAVRAIGDAQAAIAYATAVCERATRTPDELRDCVETELAAIAAGTTKAPRLPTAPAK
jgi:hypothetical protein